MALITHQTQGSYSTFSLRPKVYTKGVQVKPFVALQFVGGSNKLSLLKYRFHIRGKPIILPKGNTFKVSSFKGNVHNDESEGKECGRKLSKTPVQLSCTQKEREETMMESPDGHKHPLSYTPGDGEVSTMGSLAIQKLFRKWLIMLRTQSSSVTMDENIREETTQIATSKSQDVTIRMKVGKVLKGALMYFLGIDASISLPLLIFIPWYLSIKVVHGAEVAKELTPLWVLGPLIIALYVKIIQGLCSLYVFCFKLTVRLIKNIPTYSMLVYTFVAEGKLKAYLWAHFWKPIVDVVKLDYKDVFRQKWKQLKELVVEKYLDYIESIWPYYCRTIRFLKKANLI